MLVLGITLSLFSISVYQTFKSNLYGDIDDLLQSRAEGIVASIDTYWETEKIEAVKEGAKTSRFTKINNINFAKIAQRWVEEKSEDQKRADIEVQIYDIDAKQIAYSKDAPNISALPKEIFRSVVAGDSSFMNLDVKSGDIKTLPLRIFVMPAIEDAKTAYIVQTSRNLTRVLSTLNSLKIILFIFLPLTIIITGLAGALLAKLTLNPVNSMIKTIRAITAENLRLRLDLPDTKDELQRLAETFNDMLIKLDAAFSTQRQFIQDISHELRTPLTILKGNLEVALKRIRSTQEYEATLNSSIEEIDKITKLVDSLLILARLDNKEIPLTIQSIDLKLFIEDILADVNILVQEKGINIALICEDKVILDADQLYLRRLFLNLLDNALKFTPSNGKVTFRVRKKDEVATIEVIDTGIGISESELPYIFNRMYQVPRLSTNTGFGLGLAIARSIVEIHRGKIAAKSQINQGTTFIISIPLHYSR